MKKKIEEHILKNVGSVEADVLAVYLLASKNTKIVDLLKNRVRTKKGYKGVGLSFESRVFGAKRKNSVDAFYSNTICLTGLALLDFDLELCEDLARTLIERVGYKEQGNGLFFYFDDESERMDEYAVVNIVALCSLFLGKLYEKTGKVEYKVLSDKAIRWVVDRQLVDGNWLYGYFKYVKNDAVHLGFIIEALVNKGFVVETRGGVSALKRIVDTGKYLKIMGSNEWGLGEALYVFKLVGDEEYVGKCEGLLEGFFEGKKMENRNLRGLAFTYRGLTQKCLRL